MRTIDRVGRGNVILVGLLLLAGALVAWRVTAVKPVEVVQPQRQSVVQTLTASGQVKGAREADLAPDTPGVLAEVLVEEGALVRPGQLVARLTQGVPTAEFQQAAAAVFTAEASLAEAQGSAAMLSPSIRQAQAEETGTVQQAEARLQQARERLGELQAGGTPEDRQQAAAAVAQGELTVTQARREVQRTKALAEADATAAAPLTQARADLRRVEAQIRQTEARLDQAQLDLRRAQQLLAQDAIAKAEVEARVTVLRTVEEDLAQARVSREQAVVEVDRQRQLLDSTRMTELERAQTNVELAQRELQAARARQQTVTQPARREQLAQQRAELQAAQAALQQARRTGMERVRGLRATPAQQRVEVARRRVQEALRTREAALARLQTKDVEARFPGVVVELKARPGDTVGPTQPVLRMAEMALPEVRIEVDERDIAQIAVGQATTILADAYPDRQVRGRVVRLSPRTETARGVIGVYVRPDQREAWLRSGMTVDVSVVVAPAQNLLVIPTMSLVRQGEAARVLVVAEGVVTERAVKLGTSGEEGTVVLSGLTESDLVVVAPTTARVGQRARPTQTPKKAATDAV